MYFHNRNKRKWWKGGVVATAFFLLILFIGVASAQTPTNSELIVSTCPEQAFTILGVDSAKLNSPATYRVLSENSRQQVEVNYQLTQGENNKVIDKSTNMVRAITFDKLGEYLLKATITADKNCTYELTLPIHVYATIYTYIGPESDEIGFAHDAITDSGVIMKELIVGDTTLGAVDQQVSQFFNDNAYYIQHADSLLIDDEALGSFLEQSSKLQQLLNIDLSKINVYVFADISQSAFRRMTARYRDLVGIETMYVVEKKFMGSFLTPFLLGRPVDTLDFVKIFSTSLEDSSKLLPVSYLIDYLLQGGFPIDILVMILLVSFLALVVSFSAQVVGFNVFGVFHPLMFGLSLYILGPALTILLSAAVFLTTLLIKRFTDKVYLLYSAKVALTVVVYCIVCLLFFGVEKLMGYHLIDYDMFHTQLILFPFLFLIIVGKTVFSDKFYQFGKDRRQGLVEFIIMSLVVYRGIQRTRLQNFLLGYPEALIGIFILTIVVGRFTGLQIFEYVRFFPLIKEYFEEEEE